MGANQSTDQNGISEWTQIPGANLLQEAGKPALVYIGHNPHIYAQQYSFEIANINLQSEIQVYRIRKHYPENIVAIYDFKIVEKSISCGVNSYYLTIITEHLPRRFSSLKKITTNQALYVLYEALKGYKHLKKYKKICYPTASMIGIKDNGEIKIWINENWSLNSCREAQYQNHVVEELITIIQKKCKQKGLQLQILQKTTSLTIQDVLNEIKIQFTKNVEEGYLHLHKRINNKLQKKQLSNKIHLTRNETERHRFNEQHLKEETRRPQSCSLNRKSQQREDYRFSYTSSNTKLYQSMHNNSNRYRSHSTTVERNTQYHSSVEKQKSFYPTKATTNSIQTIKPKKIQFFNEQKQILFEDQFCPKKSQIIHTRPSFELEPHLKTKKYINFIYQNGNPAFQKRNNINSSYESNRHNGNGKVGIGRGKTIRQRSNECQLQSSLNGLREVEIEGLNSFGEYKKEIKNGINIQINNDQKSLQNSQMTTQSSTPIQNRNIHEQISSKQAVDQFKYYLRCTPTNPFHEEQPKPEQEEMKEEGKQFSRGYRCNVEEIIFEREEQEQEIV